MSKTDPPDVDRLRRDHAEAFERRSVAVSPMPMEQRLGRVIRHTRQQLKLTLADLASVAQVSVAMLSRLETGQTSASLDVLIRIGGALGIELSELFRLAETRPGAAQQMKAADQPEVVRTGTRHGHAYRLLSGQFGGRRLFESYLIDMKDDAAPYARFQHPGQEFLYMLTGRMRYRSGDELFVMEPGDSLTFLAEVVHGVEEMLDPHVQFISVLVEPAAS
ncbi:XRE family transcriptional regulator [Salipiger sp. 1_MG-2023]|uniref:helix-turn-helix domain-containing protein n=1 Tax=Salipiger sp. 1_MG-2023 TaxID=3062665 RepID=UPI0026E29893|nr:XRE family transcriptional regulator [Salipiger sp. 1_MG-2023]MDO6584724.1 XRE family transcriptional regulator [Salipiger sp. 1_MG-2023]